MMVGMVKNITQLWHGLLRGVLVQRPINFFRQFL
jgi:hypothetical protein